MMETFEIVTLEEWESVTQHPDNKVHGANMGPTWVLSAPDGPHVGSMNLAIKDSLYIDFWMNTDGKAPWF